MSTQQRVMKLSENTKGRDFVVGDIHGCYSLLIGELQRLGFDRSVDRLISVGDLVDRGPNSYNCLSLPYEKWFHGVRGNHEEMMQEALNRGDYDLWAVNGGGWAFAHDSLRDLRLLVNDVLELLPFAIEVECAGTRFGIIHAEVPNSDWTSLETAETAVMTWGRTRIAKRYQHSINGIDVVISGHTIVTRPMWLGNQLYIDTGAFHTGTLTILQLSEIAAMVREAA